MESTSKKNSAKICELQWNNEDDQVVSIENQKEIPDGLYVIKNKKLEISLNSYDKKPLRVPEHINFEKIKSTKTWDVVSEQKGDEVHTLCHNHLETWRTPQKFGHQTHRT